MNKNTQWPTNFLVIHVVNSTPFMLYENVTILSHQHCDTILRVYHWQHSMNVKMKTEIEVTKCKMQTESLLDAQHLNNTKKQSKRIQNNNRKNELNLLETINITFFVYVLW